VFFICKRFIPFGKLVFMLPFLCSPCSVFRMKIPFRHWLIRFIVSIFIINEIMLTKQHA